jgi:hypothetical protein
MFVQHAKLILIQFWVILGLKVLIRTNQFTPIVYFYIT